MSASRTVSHLWPILVIASSIATTAVGSAQAQGPASSGKRLAVSPSSSGVSTDWYVAVTGSDANDCLTPGAPCATINAAVAKAAAGDTVYVAVGTYTDPGAAVALLDKSLALSCGWDPAFATQVGQSLLDGEFARGSLRTSSGVVATVDSIVARNGPAFGSVGVSNSGTLILSHSLVEGPFWLRSIGNSGTLTLRSTTVRDNTSGAGIANDFSGTLTLEDSVVSGHSEAGIRNSGALLLDRSLVSGNIGPGIDSEGNVRVDRSTIELNGGGIQNFTGIVRVDQSTIRANSRGITNQSGNGHVGSVTVLNTTISGNTGSFYGGGIFNSGALILNNSTITDNSAESDGGGIFLNFNPGATTLSIQNSIVAGNEAGPFGEPDCAGGFTTYSSGGYNLFGRLLSSPLEPASTDLVGVDPLLGPLEDHGGPTRTHALLPGSPAVDRGNPAAPGSGPGTCEPTDQRGVLRPIGSACDIGSYEATTYMVTNTADTGAGSLRQAILDANASPGLDSIRFSIPGAGVHSIALLSSLPPISDPAFIDGFSQPGSRPNTGYFGQATNAVLNIELNGLDQAFTDCFVLTAEGTTIRGLAFTRIGRVAVWLMAGNSVIEGNYFGTNAAGNASRRNGFNLEVQSSNNRIGGEQPEARNVIASCNGSGIRVASGADDNDILGNFIGTNAAGTSALGNQFSGIELDGSKNRVRQNLVSGNGTFAGPGLTVYGSKNVVERNYIGTDVTGRLPLGNNRAGISVGGADNRIGDTYAGNLIAFNRDVFGQSGAGIEVLPPAGVQVTNPISGNSIHSNLGLGIDLRPIGVNANDPGDFDVGANGGQNYPILTSASLKPDGLLVSGRLGSERNATYRIEFFASDRADASGHGEGEVYLGHTEVTTNGSGKADFDEVLFLPRDYGTRFTRGVVSATATDALGNTSEFSACMAW